MEVLPAPDSWDCVVDVFALSDAEGNLCDVRSQSELRIDTNHILLIMCHETLRLPAIAAVIKMVMKGRSCNVRHVSRTQRVHVDWLFENICGLCNVHSLSEH